MGARLAGSADRRRWDPRGGVQTRPELRPFPQPGQLPDQHNGCGLGRGALHAARVGNHLAAQQKPVRRPAICYDSFSLQFFVSIIADSLQIVGLFSGSISYGAGDPGAWMALNASEPTSVRLAQLRMEHGQAFALDAASDAATATSARSAAAMLMKDLEARDRCGRRATARSV